MKITDLIQVLVKTAIEKGEDCDILVYDEYMGEYRDYKFNTRGMYDDLIIELSIPENC